MVSAQIKLGSMTVKLALNATRSPLVVPRCDACRLCPGCCQWMLVARGQCAPPFRGGLKERDAGDVEQLGIALFSAVVWRSLQIFSAIGGGSVQITNYCNSMMSLDEKHTAGRRRGRGQPRTSTVIASGNCSVALLATAVAATYSWKPSARPAGLAASHAYFALA